MKTMTTLQAALGFVMRPSDGRKEAGKHKVAWDAIGVATWIYCVKLQQDKFTVTRKLILMR